MEKIFEYLKNKPMSPKNENWEKAIEYWSKLKTDSDAKFDKEIVLEGQEIKPMVTWGTSPQDVVEIDGQVPNPDNEKDQDRKNSIERSLNYMGLKPNTKVQDIKIDKVFIGSCTNGRIEDIREAAKILKDKPMSPKGDSWEKALEYWSNLKSDEGANFDKELNLDGKDIKPMVTWGTSPQDVVTIDGKVPNPKSETDPDKKNSIERSLKYMGLKSDISVQDIKIDKVFIGSCTNGRIEDLREAAKILKDKKIAKHVNAMVVPGSGLVKEKAEQEGLDKIFINSGFEWREPGCSMCLAMNADKLKPGERCASTSNRNFEGRQGRGGRTHLVSPGMAAAAALSGNLDDVRKYQS